VVLQIWILNVFNDIVPIKRTDFVVFINGVQLEQFDVDLSSINIIHIVDEESLATFKLSRRHDDLDKDLEGNTRQITNQNSVRIEIQGIVEFDGFVSSINSEYTETEEFVIISALATEKACVFNNVSLSLPSLNSPLTIYDIMLQNPVIFNPVIDVDVDPPKKFLGIRVNLGEKRVQSFSRLTFFDSFGNIATSIQDGTLNNPEAPPNCDSEVSISALD